MASQNVTMPYLVTNNPATALTNLYQQSQLPTTIVPQTSSQMVPMVNVSQPNRNALSLAAGIGQSVQGALGKGVDMFKNYLGFGQTGNGLNNEAIARHMNTFAKTLEGSGLSTSQMADLMNNEYFRIQEDEAFKGNSKVGSFDQAASAIGNVLGVGQAGFNLFNSIQNYGMQKKLNKATLENVRLNNDAMRTELEHRKNEIARLNKIRSNVNKQVTQGSEVKTSY